MAKPEFTVIKCQTSTRLECNCLCFAPDSRTILGCISPTIVARWDAETGEVISRIRVPRKSHSHAIKFSPDGKMLALAGEKEAVILDASSFKILKSISFPDPTIHDALDWSPHGRQVVIGGTDLQAIYWNLTSGKTMATKEYEDDNVALVAFTCNPNEILFSCNDEIFLWNLKKKTERRWLKLKARDSYTWDHALSPDKSTLISVSERGCLIRTDVKTRRSKRFKTATSSSGHTFGFSPDSRLMAMTANIDIIHVWDLAAGKQLFKWRQSRKLAAFSPVFSPDGQRLACSLDSKLFILKFAENIGRRT